MHPLRPPKDLCVPYLKITTFKKLPIIRPKMKKIIATIDVIKNSA